MHKEEIIKWSPTFACGIQTIDEQHKGLVNLLNDMYNNSTRDKETEKAYFNKVIMDVVAYVKVHFQTEEKLMLHFKFQGYLEHKKIHDSFVLVVAEKIKSFREGQIPRLLDFTNYLKDWVLTHVAIMDKQYFTYFRQIATRNADGTLTISQANINQAKQEVPVTPILKQILIVDDDVVHLAAAKAMLEKEYKITAAKSGYDALKLFHKGFFPDLVLLDLIMPEMDGWETYQRLKTVSNIYSIPTAFFTASTSKEDRLRAQQIGIKDFIQKPISQSELLERVKKLIK